MCDLFVFSPGGLSIQESERRLVTEEVWSKLKVYFPKAPEFTQEQEACQQCMVNTHTRSSHHAQ